MVRARQANNGRKRRAVKWIIAGILATGVAVAAYVVFLEHRTPPAPPKPAPLTKEEVVALLAPAKIENLTGEQRTQYLSQLGSRLAASDRQMVRETLRNEEVSKVFETLSPEDRRAMFSAAFRGGPQGQGGEGGRPPGPDMSEMRQRMNDFFHASAADQNAMLDRDLDRMAERMKRFEEMRAQHGGAPGQRGGRFASVTDDQRNQRARGMLNHTDPATRAMTQEYHRRLTNRAVERGIHMPDWSGGGRR